MRRGVTLQQGRSVGEGRAAVSVLKSNRMEMVRHPTRRHVAGLLFSIDRVCKGHGTEEIFVLSNLCTLSCWFGLEKVFELDGERLDPLSLNVDGRTCGVSKLR